MEARALAALGATDTVGTPASGGNATDYGATGLGELPNPGAFEQKCRTRVVSNRAIQSPDGYPVTSYNTREMPFASFTMWRELNGAGLLCFASLLIPLLNFSRRARPVARAHALLLS
jgi:hypothetical protein